ncbi:MAG TPA: polymer-forming cytoskeletal protein [Rhodospirillales bacterium]|nr:polymer-forming cytoskeletal protein [Rhodospirillales bacterium]
MFKKLSDEESVDGAHAKSDNEKIIAPPLKPFSKKASRQPPKAPAASPMYSEPHRPSDTLMPRRRMERAHLGDAESKTLVVGRDIHLKGQITSCEKLVVEGSVEAVLKDARIIEVSSKGFFKGSAQVVEADISGRFEGELTVEDKLTVRNSGRIYGVVRYGRIIIESGGEIAGEMESLAKDAPEEPGWKTEGDAETKPARRPLKKKT